MSKHKIILTKQDREELMPLLHITKAERELMPKEVLEKLELLQSEQEVGHFKELEEIIEESLQIVQSLTPNMLKSKSAQTHIKQQLFKQAKYHLFLAKRKAQRARHKTH